MARVGVDAWGDIEQSVPDVNTTLSGGAWPAAQTTQNDYSPDPGLGVYDPSTSYTAPKDYSLGFGGSPVTSYSTPDANNDGLNDTTGWAMGVVQDQNSPTGFSYNGQPTQSNGALYTAPQPTSYGQPAWTPSSWDQPAPQPTDYSLGFNGTAFNGYDNPNAVSPWDANAPQQDTSGGGGFWGGVKDFVQPGIDAFTNSPIVAAPIIAGNAASGLLDQWTGTSRQQRINDQLSGNALVKDVSQGNVDLNQLPYGLGYVTDAALAPASYLGWGATGGAGATAWEGVKQIGSGAIGNAAAKFGASDTASNIPVYGDQPAWLRGLEAGAVGGVAGYGAIGGIGNAAKEAGGFGPLLKSEVGSTPPLGKGGGEPLRPLTTSDKLPGESLSDFVARRDLIDEQIKTGPVPFDVRPKPKGLSPELDKLAVNDFKVAQAMLDAQDARAATQTLAEWEQTIPFAPPVTKAKWGTLTDRPLTSQEAAIINDVRAKAIAVGRDTEQSFPPARPGFPIQTTAQERALTENWTPGRRAQYETARGGTGGNLSTAAPPPAVTQTVTPPTDTSLNPIRRKIADALDAEAKFRNSGEAEAIKSVKRGEQAAGFRAAQPGATSAETLANVSAGGKVGKFFDNTPGLKLPEADYNAALADVMQNTPDGFDIKKGVTALSKLQNGERLQPGEIKTLGKLYGPEVEAKIRMTNQNRIQTVADLTPEDTARIARQAEVDGKRIATLEVTAQRQHELADNLQKQLNMDPTNKSLKTAAENARARAISQENQANSLLADQARKLETKQNQKAFTAAQKAAQKDSTNALRSDLSAEFKASGQAKMAEAEKLIDDANISPVLKTQLKQTLAVQLKTNGAVLDGMGKDGPGVIRKIYAATTGQVTDSWTSKLLSQEALLRNSLEVQGLDEKTARQVARLLQDAEIKMRFGDATPKYVQDSLDQARGIQRDGMGKIIKGENGPEASMGLQTAESVAHLSQVLKNTTMGIGDVAVVGVNGPKAILTDAPTLIAGTINRLLNKAHLGIDTGFATNNLPRAAQKALDGISGSTIGVTDLSKDGTIISLIPKIGPTLDKGPVKIAAGLMDLQYKKIMGSIRDVAHEGNLVLAHVAGLDVNDPLVRQQAAKWANVGTLSADLAQRKGRAAAERAGMMSPTMRRAQIQQGGLIARGLAALGSDATYIATFGKVAKQMDSAARLDELKAITTIASTAMVTLAVGKYLNDWIGLEPFQFDPSKPGFGNMTVPDGAGGTMVVNLFPQEQIAKASARSLRLIAEGKVTDADWTAVLKEWGKVGITSSSPPVSMFEKGILNTGFDPQAGQYKFGDFNQGLKKNLVGAFLPPIAQSVINEGFGPISTPLQGAGFNVYPESQYQTRDRWIKQNQGLFTGDLVQPGKTPDKYANLSPTGKQLADAQAGKAAPFGQEGKDAAGVVQKMTVLQGEDDTKRQMGQLTPEDWRRNYTSRKEELFIRNDQIYAKLRDSGKLTSKNPDPILDPYYKAIEASKAGNGGQPNWDQVDAYRAALGEKANAYIDANTGMVKISTPETQKFQQDYNSIKNSGYFDKADQSWQQVSSLVPTWDKLGSPVNPSDYQSYDAWRQAALQAGLKLAGKTTEDIATVTEINSWLDKQDPAKGQAYYTGQWSDQWVASNPKAAYEAWKYGYFNPKKEIKAWLASKYE